MDNPVLYRRNCACIIKRYIQRVQARNKATEHLQNIIHAHDNPINEHTMILGTPTGARKARKIHTRWFYSSGSNGQYYAYDIRELYHHLRQGYGEARCPYTRRPFTKYEKYFIVRQYHRMRAEGIPDLDLEVPHKDTVQSLQRELCALLSPYNAVTVDDITQQTWYILLHDLAMEDRYRMGMYILLYNQAQYHYLQGNQQAFLCATYRLLIRWIKEHHDPTECISHIALQLSPISIPFDFDEVTDAVLDRVIPVPRQADGPPEGERPARRRRIEIET